MSNINSEQLSFYKLFSEKDINIEIPIIQRDYAQGRKSVSEIRNGFLKALYDYLEEGKPRRDLDFIYGDIQKNGDNQKNILTLLDGQQRMTTLFLLHWYLAQKEGKYDTFKADLLDGKNSRFTYKVRQSSTDFCNTLLKYGINLSQLKDKEKALSNAIRDSYWFFLSWEKDPTVQSILTMLDAIHYKFKDSSGFYDKLTDIKNPVITFQFLPLKDYGLTEDLYIKMNSRGKPLTWFENFKAKFEKHLSKEPFKSKKYLLKYSNQEEKEENIKTYFSHKIDTQWTDLFWSFKVRKEKQIDGELVVDYEVDDLMANFVTTLAINHAALSRAEVKWLIDKQTKIPLSFYTELNEDFADTLIKTLDILSESPSLSTFLSDFHYFNEVQAFKDVLNISEFNDAQYSSRIHYFAYYSYLVYNEGNSEGLADWMRIIVNLSENTAPYNSPLEYISAIRSIRGLLQHSSSIMEYVKTDAFLEVDGFNEYQVKEERIKSHLFDVSDVWKNKILKYEKHQYFKGQLTSALAFADVELYYDEHKNCNWETDKDEDYLAKFDNYISKIFTLFNESGLVEEAAKNHQMHRAILTKGMYLINAKSNLSFLNNSNRDVSWKRFLQGDGERKTKRNFFKEVLDDDNFNENNLDCLSIIASHYKETIPLWQKLFIQKPILFNHEYIGSFKYIRNYDHRPEYKNEAIFLIKKIKTSGEHFELFSLNLYLELCNEKFFKEPNPFMKLDYYSPSGTVSKPCMFLDNWEFDEYNIALEVFYQYGNRFKLKFFDRNGNELPSYLKGILIQKGFTKTEYYYTNSIKEEEVKKTIVELCESLKELECHET